ncbi:hypothetical protein Acr_28g0009520 [Actinidia rufa]|uniref:Uncharacterized protein n=1 Tax=Actinidia rufa TaxID=165716 RepID=A0A7J0HAW5_9ERIC|nr:hypothetical protein Acr_28g0009520 [Actinidia rufa]
MEIEASINGGCLGNSRQTKHSCNEEHARLENDLSEGSGSGTMRKRTCWGTAGSSQESIDDERQLNCHSYKLQSYFLILLGKTPLIRNPYLRSRISKLIKKPPSMSNKVPPCWSRF